MSLGRLLIFAVFFSALCLRLAAGDVRQDVSSVRKFRFSGTVEQVSTIPEAAKSDYPDCYYSILLRLGKIPAEQKEIVLLVKCFENKKDIPGNRFKKGDLVAAECIAFDDAPEGMRQTQQSEQIERYDLNSFFAIKISKTENLGAWKNSEVIRKAEEKFISPPPISEKIKREISENIKAELASVSARLLSRGGGKTIRINYSEKARESLDRFRQSGNPNDLLYWEKGRVVRVDPNFKVLDPDECNDRAVEIVTAFDRELKQRNIRFIFVSCPLPWEPILPLITTNVTPQMSFDETRLKTVKSLLENGVEVIELGHYLYEKPFDSPFFFDILANDAHPMDRIVDFLADLLKDRLRSYDFSRYEYPASCFSAFELEFLRRNRYPEGNPKFTGIPKVQGYTFHPTDKVPLVKSPVLVIGDSFSQTPWQTGGLRSFLGAKTRLFIDGFQVQSGSTRLMRVLSARNYVPLSRKQVVIMFGISMCFSSSYAFWESLKTARKIDGIIQSANCPESWKPSVKTVDDFLYFDTEKEGINFVTGFLELELPGFKDSQNCEISARISTKLAQLRVYDRSRRQIVYSGVTDVSGEMDNVTVSIPYDRVWGEKVFIRLFTQVPQKIRIKDISFSFTENPRSSILHGPDSRLLTFDDFKSKNKKMADENHIRFDGNGYFVEIRKYLKLRPDSRIVVSGKIRNVGTAPVKFSYALGLYDANGDILSPQNYPFRDNKRNYTVVSAEAGKNSIVIDSCPAEWGKGCALARYDGKSHTNRNDILGYIENIEKRADGSAVVTLKKELQKAPKNGEKVRINNAAGSYLYFGTKKISSGQKTEFRIDISGKGPCSRFSTRALPDGACYVKPIVFVCPAAGRSDSAVIDISEWQVKF